MSCCIITIKTWCISSQDAEEALEYINTERFDIIVANSQMRGLESSKLIYEVKKKDPYCEIILIGTQAQTTDAIAALKMGAFDYIVKPFYLEQLRLTIQRAIEYKKLQVELDRRRRGFLTVYEVSEYLTKSIDIDEISRMVLDKAVDMMEADEGSIMLINNGELEIRAVKGLPENLLHTTIKIGDKIAGYSVAHKKPLLLIGGVKNYPEFSHLEERLYIHSSIVVPLIIEERVKGVISLNRTKRTVDFTEDDLKYLHIFGAEIALAIENIRLKTK
jgi:CheY-like chemotaxis protein/putative methionine-R-sulfoxide reductase with GAF domain